VHIIAKEEVLVVAKGKLPVAKEQIAKEKCKALEAKRRQREGRPTSHFSSSAVP
jgi:hypothetical protein